MSQCDTPTNFKNLNDKRQEEAKIRILRSLEEFYQAHKKLPSLRALSVIAKAHPKTVKPYLELAKRLKSIHDPYLLDLCNNIYSLQELESNNLLFTSRLSKNLYLGYHCLKFLYGYTYRATLTLPSNSEQIYLLSSRLSSKIIHHFIKLMHTQDYMWVVELQQRGSLHWHIDFKSTNPKIGDIKPNVQFNWEQTLIYFSNLTGINFLEDENNIARTPMTHLYGPNQPYLHKKYSKTPRIINGHKIAPRQWGGLSHSLTEKIKSETKEIILRFENNDELFEIVSGLTCFDPDRWLNIKTPFNELIGFQNNFSAINETRFMRIVNNIVNSQNFIYGAYELKIKIYPGGGVKILWPKEKSN